jgi:hypothetical protein
MLSPELDLAALVVPRSGQLVATGNRYEPYQLLDPDGVPVVAVTAYFRDLLAAGRAESTVRSGLVSSPPARPGQDVGDGMQRA